MTTQNQLKGAAGVQISVNDLSPLPSASSTAYRIGLVGWSPKGPSNTPIKITNETDLYSYFGTPKGYKPYQVYMLHNAKILLSAGAEIVLVRTVAGIKIDDGIKITEITEKLNYGVYHLTTTAAINSTDASNSLQAISNNIATAISTKKNQQLKASADTDSPFTMYLKYPGFDGYYVSLQTFESAIVATDGPNGGTANTLNIAPGLSYYSANRAAFKSYVQSIGIYNEYYEVALGAESTPKFMKADAAGIYYLTGSTYSKSGSGTTYSLSSLNSVGSTAVYPLDTTNTSFSTLQTYLYPNDKTGTYSTTQTYAMYGDAYNSTNGKFYTAKETVDANGDPVYALKSAFDNISITGNDNFAPNPDLDAFLDVFAIVRVFSAKTDSTPLETLYLTTTEYVTDSGDQLEASSISSNVLTFKMNDSFGSVSVKDKGVDLTLLEGGSVLSFSRSSTALASAWGLFDDLTNVDVSLLVDGGSSIVGFGTDRENDGLESVDMNVVSAMLTTSTNRMDAPSIIDVPKRSSVNDLITLFKKYPSIGNESNGSTASYAVYWGNAQDGRQIINDTYNKKQIEVARSVFKAVTAFNVYSNSYPWQTQWGPNRGLITSPSVGTINPRTYPDEVGLLSTNRINPSRLTSTGEYFWDDYTLMAKSSVLQRWHAVCFLANLNKRYRVILEQYVAELNTPALRKAIWTVLNDDLNFIMNHAVPQGLYNYYVICDDTNNTDTVIDSGQLNVDIGLEIVRDTRVISLTTTLYRTGGIVSSGIKV